jgi:LPXTG-motif cell wall-anchored protein
VAEGSSGVASESPSTSTDALSTVGESSSSGDSRALTLVAGGAVLLLATAAGVIAWRRRS